MQRALPKQKLQIVTVEPKYESNYNKGYIGFTYHNNNVVAKGIVHFTHWNCMSDIYATHALIVTGEDSCIEADANRDCVKRGSLKHYFDEPHCQIFFRKPKSLTNEIADRIVQAAESQVGKHYDFKLILAQAISGTFVGHLYDRLVQGKFENWLASILNEPDRWICSELAAYALDEQPEYKDQGILKRPNATINPQELFEDSFIFEPWKNQSVEKCSEKLSMN